MKSYCNKKITSLSQEHEKTAFLNEEINLSKIFKELENQPGYRIESIMAYVLDTFLRLKEDKSESKILLDPMDDKLYKNAKEIISIIKRREKIKNDSFKLGLELSSLFKHDKLVEHYGTVYENQLLIANTIKYENEIIQTASEWIDAIKLTHLELNRNLASFYEEHIFWKEFKVKLSKLSNLALSEEYKYIIKLLKLLGKIKLSLTLEILLKSDQIDDICRHFNNIFSQLDFLFIYENYKFIKEHQDLMDKSEIKCSKNNMISIQYNVLLFIDSSASIIDQFNKEYECEKIVQKRICKQIRNLLKQVIENCSLFLLTYDYDSDIKIHQNFISKIFELFEKYHIFASRFFFTTESSPYKIYQKILENLRYLHVLLNFTDEFLLIKDDFYVKMLKDQIVQNSLQLVQAFKTIRISSKTHQDEIYAKGISVNNLENILVNVAKITDTKFFTKIITLLANVFTMKEIIDFTTFQSHYYNFKDLFQFQLFRDLVSQFNEKNIGFIYENHNIKNKSENDCISMVKYFLELKSIQYCFEGGLYRNITNIIQNTADYIQTSINSIPNDIGNTKILATSKIDDKIYFSIYEIKSIENQNDLKSILESLSKDIDPEEINLEHLISITENIKNFSDSYFKMKSIIECYNQVPNEFTGDCFLKRSNNSSETDELFIEKGQDPLCYFNKLTNVSWKNINKKDLGFYYERYRTVRNQYQHYKNVVKDMFSNENLNLELNFKEYIAAHGFDIDSFAKSEALKRYVLNDLLENYISLRIKQIKNGDLNLTIPVVLDFKKIGGLESQVIDISSAVKHVLIYDFKLGDSELSQESVMYHNIINLVEEIINEYRKVLDDCEKNIISHTKGAFFDVISVILNFKSRFENLKLSCLKTIEYFCDFQTVSLTDLLVIYLNIFRQNKAVELVRTNSLRHFNINVNNAKETLCTEKFLEILNNALDRASIELTNAIDPIKKYNIYNEVKNLVKLGKDKFEYLEDPLSATVYNKLSSIVERYENLKESYFSGLIYDSLSLIENKRKDAITEICKISVSFKCLKTQGQTFLLKFKEKLFACGCLIREVDYLNNILEECRFERIDLEDLKFNILSVLQEFELYTSKVEKLNRWLLHPIVKNEISYDELKEGMPDSANSEFLQDLIDLVNEIKIPLDYLKKAQDIFQPTGDQNFINSHKTSKFSLILMEDKSDKIESNVLEEISEILQYIRDKKQGKLKYKILDQLDSSELEETSAFSSLKSENHLKQDKNIKKVQKLYKYYTSINLQEYIKSFDKNEFLLFLEQYRTSSKILAYLSKFSLNVIKNFKFRTFMNTNFVENLDEIETIIDHEREEYELMIKLNRFKIYILELEEVERMIDKQARMVVKLKEIQEIMSVVGKLFANTVDSKYNNNGESNSLSNALPYDHMKYQHAQSIMISLVNQDINEAETSLSIAYKIILEINEALKKTFSDYRITAPRLYFVSDEDIIKMISDTQNLGDIIKSLFDVECIMIENDKIIGIHSIDGKDRISFQTAVDLLGFIPNVINNFENSLQKSLKQYFFNQGPCNAKDYCSLIEEMICEYNYFNYKKPNLDQKMAQLNETNTSKFLLKNEIANYKVKKIQEYAEVYPEFMDLYLKPEICNNSLLFKANVDPNTSFECYFEYFSPSSFIFTSLTAKIFSNISLAMHLPGVILYGPSGTGKTETIKYFCRSIGKQVYTFCCNEKNTIQSLVNIIKGCSRMGAYICFDEFNRLTSEVMSAVTECIYENKDKVKIFLTMNLGYKGRNELPKSLKILFAEVHVIEPDIKDVIYYYTKSYEIYDIIKALEAVLNNTGKEDKNSNYDFGLRPVKYILMNSNSSYTEKEKLAYYYMASLKSKDKNIFLQTLNEHNTSTTLDFSIQNLLKVALSTKNGILITGTRGKTTLVNNESINRKSRCFRYNPSNILLTNDCIYGSVSHTTKEWIDSVFLRDLRSVLKNDSEAWFVFDGPIKSEWIEDFNSVLDDNRIICLSTGERIVVPFSFKFIFEAVDAINVTPATLTRVFHINIDDECLKEKYIESKSKDEKTFSLIPIVLDDYPGSEVLDSIQLEALNSFVPIIESKKVLILKGPSGIGKKFLTKIALKKSFAIIYPDQIIKEEFCENVAIFIEEFDKANIRLREQVREFAEFGRIGEYKVKNLIIICGIDSESINMSILEKIRLIEITKLENPKAIFLNQLDSKIENLKNNSSLEYNDEHFSEVRLIFAEFCMYLLSSFQISIRKIVSFIKILSLDISHLYYFYRIFFEENDVVKSYIEAKICKQNLGLFFNCKTGLFENGFAKHHKISKKEQILVLLHSGFNILIKGPRLSGKATLAQDCINSYKETDPTVNIKLIHWAQPNISIPDTELFILTIVEDTLNCKFLGENASR